MCAYIEIDAIWTDSSIYILQFTSTLHCTNIAFFSYYFTICSFLLPMLLSHSYPCVYTTGPSRKSEEKLKEVKELSAKLEKTTKEKESFKYVLPSFLLWETFACHESLI